VAGREKLKQKNEVRLVIVAIACLALLLIVGLSVALQRPLYVSQSSLTTTYNTPFANAYWKAAYFNDSQGTERAFFNFAFRDTNDSLGPVLSTIQFGPGLSGSYLDSAKFTFTSETPLTWPDVAFRIPINGLTPTQISRVNTQTVVISCQSLGLGGQGTEVFDFWFGIGNAGSYTTQSVVLTVNISGHIPQSALTEHSYSGEATFHIVSPPNGTLYVSDTP